MTVVRRIASPVVRPLVRAINAAYGISSAFTPAKLFTTGVNGAWYDPSDYSTLFQNAAGTTPVTAVEQPVGLMLDKSKGLVLGSELVTNGDFSNPTPIGWVGYLGATVSVDTERLKLLSAGGNPYAIYAITTAVDKWYKFVVGYDSAGFSGSLNIYPASNTSGGSLATTSSVTGSGTRTVYFRATGTTSYVLVQALNLPSGQFVFFDNISVRELPGNHAFNGSGNSANFPVLSARKNKLLATAVLSTQTVTTRAVGHVLSFWGTGTITLSGTSTAGPLVGTGASDRVYLEFTPTAGTLTLTVSGSVLKAQLEEVNETV